MKFFHDTYGIFVVCQISSFTTNHLIWNNFVARTPSEIDSPVSLKDMSLIIRSKILVLITANRQNDLRKSSHTPYKQVSVLPLIVRLGFLTKLVFNLLEVGIDGLRSLSRFGALTHQEEKDHR